MIIDKDIVRQRFNRNLRTYNDNAYIQKDICKRLVNKADLLNKNQFKNIFEIGSGTGLLTELLIKNFKPNNLYINDIAMDSKKYVSGILNGYEFDNLQYIMGDAETIDFPEHLDLIISSSTIQWFNDVQKFIDRSSNALKSNGVLAFSTFGTENFREIKNTMNSGLNYIPKEKYHSMLQKEFNFVSSDEYIETMYFKNPVEVLKHIKSLGANGNNMKGWTPKDLRNFSMLYEDKFCERGGVKLTYHPVIIVAIKK